ncbi:fibroblast growth factor receptor-like 1 [Acanthaster planci]|uniref:Fibroblast growth factor receptor-like 1 n=1 Tax=Acanthaster planci TaxID=133434 RepID=A0A8B7XLC5_ACAPL|nr:fibroblast growth factor receptor-like 1 [Acanthaster planci]XP_022080758.1 fibroblast growth factor receptor-like 1 [Acanthaster planci]XP_022080759.1 fibroblast growth factor receptor-like 1 [Acanthaster planci]XP_022080760.1 fibroblast growth factor receptor-like 1 [Acanthaster planci]
MGRSWAALMPGLLLVCLAVDNVLADVQGPPRLDQPIVGFQKARVGSKIKLLCPVVGNPPPLMMWKKDGESINTLWERFKVLSAGLKIKNVEMADAGQYICRATNGFGSVSLNYTLTVVEDRRNLGRVKNSERPEAPTGSKPPTGTKPKFSQPSKMRKKKFVCPLNSSVKLKCAATGYPKPQVLWMRNGVTLTEEELEEQRASFTLKLKSLKASDSGDYTCVVFNRNGQINATYSVEVVDQAHAKPVLQGEHPVNTTVAYGGTTSFQCRVRSDSPPHIQWLKRVEPHNGNQRINATIDMDGQKFVVLPAGEVWSRPDGSYLNKLMISHATEEDSGMYICLGANTNGYSVKSAFLEVLPDPNGRSQPGGRNNNFNVNINMNDVVAKQNPQDIDTTKKVLLITIPLAFAVLFCLGAAVCTYHRNKNIQGYASPATNQPSNHLAVRAEHKRNTPVHPNQSDCEQSVPLTSPPSSLGGVHSYHPPSREGVAINRYTDLGMSAESYSDTLNSSGSVSSGKVHTHQHVHQHHVVHHC